MEQSPFRYWFKVERVLGGLCKIKVIESGAIEEAEYGLHGSLQPSVTLGFRSTCAKWGEGETSSLGISQLCRFPNLRYLWNSIARCFVMHFANTHSLGLVLSLASF